MSLKYGAFLAACVVCCPALADQRTVYLEDSEGQRIEIATLDVSDDGDYSVAMNDAAFTDHFLSMRPFKCLEGPAKHWCHVPYPYPNARNISQDTTDLEYDFLFLWKGATEYGINMWNGVYYKLDKAGDALTGTLYEMDMNTLASPPDDGNLRPVAESDLHESEPESHWLPKLVIE